MRLTIKVDERGLVYKDGNYVKMLGPGKYFKNIFANVRIDILNVNDPFQTAKNLKLYMQDEKLMKELDIIDVNDNEVTIKFEDGHFAGVLLPGKYAFWNVLKEYRFIKVDLNNPELPADLDETIITSVLKNRIVDVYEIANHENGILTFNGEFKRILTAGKYYFVNGFTNVDVQKVDMRMRQLDMAGQEIMTKDKVTLRLNFVTQYKISDPVKAVMQIRNFEEQLYILMQLVLREYVGSLKLDELLEKKEEVRTFVLKRLNKEAADWGLKFISTGIKDIILPGEMKTILSRVIEAEKQAQANIITRREETASTRSLLNTAKLMEENPILLKLKELEYIEQISNRISNLSVVGGGQIIDQLRALFSGLTKGEDNAR